MAEINVLLGDQEFAGHRFSIYGTVQKPLFLAKDVAEMLDYAKTAGGAYHVASMVASVPEDMKLVSSAQISGQRRAVTMLNENGLYFLLMRSDKPQALPFQRRVTELLVELRLYGITGSTEVLNDPDKLAAKAIELLRQRAAANERYISAAEEVIELQGKTIKHQEDEIGALKPKAEFCDSVLARTGQDELLNMSQISACYGISAVRLNRILHELKIQHRTGSGKRAIWIPYEEYKKSGFTDIRPYYPLDEHGNRKPIPKLWMYWTWKGLEFLFYKLRDSKYNLLPLGS